MYVLFDEDFESKPGYTLSDDTLDGLAKAWKLIGNDVIKGCPYKELQTMNTSMENPILIVSHPQSIEGFLLRLLGKPQEILEGKTTKQLKIIIASFLNNISLNNEDEETILGYDKKIAKYNNEIKQSDPLNKKHLGFLESKIEEYKRNKSKVIFMRFLYENLPLSVIRAKRENIPEVDILLKALGL